MTYTFEVTWRDINEQGELATFSRFIRASSWAEAESLITPVERVHGKVIGIMDEASGVLVDLDNLN